MLGLFGGRLLVCIVFVAKLLMVQIIFISQAVCIKMIDFFVLLRRSKGVSAAAGER